MSTHTAIGLLFPLLVLGLLTTCQLQYSQSNGVTFKVLLPQGISSGARSVVKSSSQARSIVGPTGTTVQVTILTQSGATWESSQPFATNGQTSVTFSFGSPPTGTYQATATLMDATGTLLDQATPVSFTVGTQSSTVVLTIPGADLYTAVLTNGSVTEGFVNAVDSPTPFLPTTYSYVTQFLPGEGAYYLTLTAVDPSATLSVSLSESSPGNSTPLPAGSPSGSVCTLDLESPTATVTVVVTSANGAATQTYTIDVNVST